MCGGGSGGGGDARELEQERQERIARGTDRIEQIFAELEGQRWVDPALVQNPNYEDPSDNPIGRAFQEGPMGGGREPRYVIGDQQAFNEAMREGSSGALEHLSSVMQGGSLRDVPDSIKENLSTDRLTRGRTVDDPNLSPIWEQQRQAYLDMANPQLDDQYDDARKDLSLALSRQGQLRGSLAANRSGELVKDRSLREQDIMSEADRLASERERMVMDMKGDVRNSLEASANPESATAMARDSLSRLSNLETPSAVGPLFQNATAGLAASRYGEQQGNAQRRYNDVVYGGRNPGRSSGRVVR